MDSTANKKPAGHDARIEAHAESVLSGLPAFKTAGPVRAVGSDAVVVVRLSSAKALLKRWQGEAARDVRWARKAQKTGGAQNLMLANQYAFEAKVRKEYAEELRLLLASATERQPQHNTKVSHGGSAPLAVTHG